MMPTEKSRDSIDHNLYFTLFPDFAKWILDNRLDEYCQIGLELSKEEKVPLLKFFEQIPEEEFLAIIKNGGIELLNSFVNNTVLDYLEHTTQNYKNNMLPLLERDTVLAEDITLISLVRKRTFRKLLYSYTQDIDTFGTIMEELDRFITFQEMMSFNTFIDIQADRLKIANDELASKNNDLLEAEALAGMGSYNWDIQNKKSQTTPGIEKILHTKSNGEFLNFIQHVHVDDKHLVESAMQEAFESDGRYQCNYRYYADKELKWISARGQVSFDKEGRPLSMKGTIMDITEEMTLLQKLQEGEKLNKHVQAITHVGNWTWDIVTNKVYWSDEMYRIYGMKPQSEQITLEKFFSFVHPDDQEQRKADIEESLRTGIAKDYVIRINAADGKRKVLKGLGEIITDKNNNPVTFVGSCQDITKEHHLQKKMEEREIYLSHLIDNAPDAIIVYDSDFKIRLFNPKSEEIFGYEENEIVGKSFLKTLFPKRLAEEYETKLCQKIKDGDEFYYELELIAKNKSDQEFHASMSVSSSSKIEERLFIAFMRDITISKQLQLELEKVNISLSHKNSELEHINKELKSYNYVVSHDLKEPLRKVQMFTDRIIAENGNVLPDLSKDYLNKTIAATTRMKQLIDDLLTFSQSTVSENSNFSSVDLQDILNEVSAEMSTTLEEHNAEINSDTLPTVWGINFQLQQVFSNLISNAIKYGPEDKSISPRIKITYKKQNKIPFAGAKKNQSYHVIAIKDNGIGFEQIYAEKIFELFQRLHTRDKYSGTGVGLAICKKIMHNHHGFMSAKSKLGKGSTFYLYFPVVVTN